MKRPDRVEREAAALRANLLKRKQQARLREEAGREEVEADHGSGETDDRGTTSADRE